MNTTYVERSKPPTDKELLDKLKQAHLLIFEVEQGFNTSERDDRFMLHGYRARIELGHIENELLIRMGVRR